MPEGAPEVWAGELPVVFVLAPNEVTTHEAPLPFHMCLPRQSLLPFVTAAVRQHFQPFAPPTIGKQEPSEPWYDHNEVPLRWQIPAGVLFDLHAGEQRAADLPWRLTVHFQSFPSATLLSSAGTAAEQLLMNSLKESCYMRCGSSAPAMSLSPVEQKQLTRALATNNHAAYDEVDRRLRAGVAGQLGPSGLVQAVPVRVFTSPTEWRQQPVAPNLPSGEATQLLHLLAELLPRHYGTDAPSRPAVIVQGISVPLETPLLWLYDACSHPDGFLYVCCTLPSAATAPVALG